jgi:hypothetical protein
MPEEPPPNPVPDKEPGSASHPQSAQSAAPGDGARPASGETDRSKTEPAEIHPVEEIALPDATGTVPQRLGKGEPRAPRPTGGHAPSNSTETTKEDRTARRHGQGGRGPSQPGTTGGDQQPPRDAPPAPATAGATTDPSGAVPVLPGETVAELFDQDCGLWQVITETSLYVLDLEQRWILRTPGAGPRASDPGNVVRHFPHDHRFTPLIRLLTCRIGERMHLLMGRQVGAEPVRSASTEVLQILCLSIQPPGPGRSQDEIELEEEP